MSCPDCNTLQNRRQFLAEMQEQGKDVKSVKEKLKLQIKQAKLPLYPQLMFCSLLLVATISSFVRHYDEKQAQALVKEYYQNPQRDVLLILNFAKEKFPYAIIFVKNVDQDQSEIFYSKYSYKYLHNAKEALEEIQNHFKKSGSSENLCEKDTVKTEELLAHSIVYVERCATAASGLPH